MDVFDLDELFESSTLSKAMLGLKINGDLDSFNRIYKKDHGNKKLYEYIQKCNDIDELRYIRNDTRRGVIEFDKIIERINKVQKDGLTRETRPYYNGINKKYINKGVTAKDVAAVKSYTVQTILPAITKRIAEISKKDKK